MRSIALLTLALLLLAAPGAEAAFYGDFVGTDVDFNDVNDTTTSAGDPDGLFGPPTVVGNTLLFFPTQFSASATGGANDVTEATLDATVVAKGDKFISEILIEEFGDVDLSGVGTAATNASVAVSGDITVVEDINGPIAPEVIAFVLLFSPKDTFELMVDQGFNTWSGSKLIDVESVVPFARKAFVSVENTFDANSEPGTTALIEKKVLNAPQIVVSIVPEPASGALLGLGLLGLGLGRRRRA